MEERNIVSVTNLSRYFILCSIGLVMIAYLSLPKCSYAQNYNGSTITVTGKVIGSSSKNPLPGVNIIVKGTTHGTATNKKGFYSLSNVSKKDTLVYSYIGYISKAIPVKGHKIINVTLKPRTIKGKEMVVVGYGEQKKQNLTGAVSSIQAKQVTQLPSATVTGSLVGKVAGVNTRQASGRPGVGATINIRNFGNPLYVIDGVPESQGDFDELNPNSIKSISVLKGASAAIYGSRAANGVILVTTKSGNYKQKNQVHIDSYYGFQTWDRFPVMATAAQYVKATIEANMNQYGSTNYTPATLKKWQQGTQLGYLPFNWDIFARRKDVPQYHVSANVSGGTQKTKYYLAFGRINQEGVFKQYDYHRTNMEASVTTRAFKNLEVGIHVKGRREVRPHPGVPGLFDYFAPLHGLFNQHPIYWPYANYNTRYPQTTNQLTSDPALNIKSITGSYRSDWRVLTTNLHAKYKFPIKGLVARGKFSYYYAENFSNDFEYTYKTYSYDSNTQSYNVTGGNQNPYRSRTTNLFQKQTYQLQLNYKRTFHKTKLSGMAAFEVHHQKNPGYYIHSIPSTNYISLIKTNELQNINDWLYHSGREAFIWRLNYNYNKTYIVDFSGRYDASSAFPPHKRWGWFPSISAGWRISNEPFFKNSGLSNTISNLKLRASYGILGDDNIGISPYAYYQGYNYGSGNYVFDKNIYT
ncbi:MAG TPA: SusC/RagA family TonB-linked outer membrane protein, partial [Bacteroidales bacterium]|nr:SusC/RagA family TonB-linked outer membrane protein [Bacteroidales bacterium]